MKGRCIKVWMVTGTFHGSHVYAYTEGEARRIFHKFYNGESIVHVSAPRFPDPLPLDNEP